MNASSVQVADDKITGPFSYLLGKNLSTDDQLTLYKRLEYWLSTYKGHHFLYITIGPEWQDMMKTVIDNPSCFQTNSRYNLYPYLWDLFRMLPGTNVKLILVKETQEMYFRFESLGDEEEFEEDWKSLFYIKVILEKAYSSVGTLKDIADILDNTIKDLEFVDTLDERNETAFLKTVTPILLSWIKNEKNEQMIKCKKRKM